MESHERKPDVSPVKRTILDRFITWTSHLPPLVRLTLHIFTILLITGTDIGILYLAVGSDWTVLIPLSLVMVGQNLLIFYGFVYWALPKLVYKRRLIWLTLVIGLIFWVIYLINRVAIFAVEPEMPKSIQYINRIQDIFGPTGVLGCFTSLRVFLWNFVFSCLALLIPLGIKVMQETLIFRQKQFDLKQSLLLLNRDNTLLKMNFLKAQISPHFLFNTLNSIYSRVVGVDEQAADLVLRLAELMRYNLYEANAARVPLYREMDYLRSYMTLEKARHGERLSVAFTTSITPATPHLIAPLMLSTYVENAFKHGIKSGIDGAYITIDAQLDHNMLRFVVENSQNKGVTVTPSHRSGGVGLPNVSKRLDLQYPNRYKISHDITDEYYRVVLQIQLETAHEKAGSALTPEL